MNTSNQNVSQNSAFSLFSGQRMEDPFPVFAQLRGIGAVIPIQLPMAGQDRQAWMVTRMEEALQVLRDHALFTVDPSTIEGHSDAKEGLTGNTDRSAAPSFLTSSTMLSVDEPDHRRLRGLVSKAFTPGYMENLRPRVQELADELLDRVQAQGEMDLVKDYAYPLPINVICEMLGVPHDDRKQIHTWSGAIARGLGLGKQDPEVAKNMRAFGEYIAQLVADKRQNPADDLISQMIESEEEGDRLSEKELLSTISLLIFAGHETTANLIATGTLMLLDHPEQLEKLQADHSLVPSAVEELLRFNGPSTMVGPRFATEDTELGGQQIKKGDIIITVSKSANRDELQFSNPEELDLTRKIHRHLAFGYGIHMCLGAPLARVEADIAFTTLLKRMPDLRLAIPREEVTWNFSLSSQSLAALPLAF